MTQYERYKTSKKLGLVASKLKNPIVEETFKTAIATRVNWQASLLKQLSGA